LFANQDAPWLLKGGYAMELRIKSARTTRDIDLALRSMPGSGSQWDDTAVRRSLQDLADADLGDGFEFFIGEPTMDLDAAPCGGHGAAGSSGSGGLPPDPGRWTASLSGLISTIMLGR
jgi:hypothetical protein